MARLGRIGIVRSVRVCIVDLRERLDAGAESGHWQFRLFLHDHAGDFPRWLGVGRFYLCPHHGRARSSLEHVWARRTLGRAGGHVDDSAVRKIAPAIRQAAARFRRFIQCFSLASSFPVGAGNVFADGAAGIDFPSGGPALYPKSLSSGHRGRQFLRRQYGGRYCRRLCRRVYFDPDHRRAKFDCLCRGDESLDWLFTRHLGSATC